MLKPPLKGDVPQAPPHVAPHSACSLLLWDQANTSRILRCQTSSHTLNMLYTYTHFDLYLSRDPLRFPRVHCCSFSQHSPEGSCESCHLCTFALIAQLVSCLPGGLCTCLCSGARIQRLVLDTAVHDSAFDSCWCSSLLLTSATSSCCYWRWSQPARSTGDDLHHVWAQQSHKQLVLKRC